MAPSEPSFPAMQADYIATEYIAEKLVGKES